MFQDEFVEAAKADELQDDAEVGLFEYDRQQLHNIHVTQRVHLRLTHQLVGSSVQQQQCEILYRGLHTSGRTKGFMVA